MLTLSDWHARFDHLDDAGLEIIASGGSHDSYADQARWILEVRAYRAAARE